VLLWRAGLRIHEALALTDGDLDQRRGSLLAAGRATARMARNRRRAIPFVVDVRDETPTTS
jgi:integrase